MGGNVTVLWKNALAKAAEYTLNRPMDSRNSKWCKELKIDKIQPRMQYARVWLVEKPIHLG